MKTQHLRNIAGTSQDIPHPSNQAENSDHFLPVKKLGELLGYFMIDRFRD
jgi:hypothetical protein